MSETLTEAQTFRRAAETLRRFVADLSDCGGPWSVHTNPRGYPQSVTNVGVPLDVCQTHTDPGHEPVTAQYIATMQPGVALALVAVFEAWARVAEVGGDLDSRIGGAESLAAARQIVSAEKWTAPKAGRS